MVEEQQRYKERRIECVFSECFGIDPFWWRPDLEVERGEVEEVGGIHARFYGSQLFIRLAVSCSQSANVFVVISASIVRTPR